MTDQVRSYSLRRRLLVGMGAGFLCILASISAGLWNHARDAANHSFDLLLTAAALAILERTVGSPGGPTVDVPYSALEMVGLAKDDRVFYRVFGQGGATLTGDPDLPVPDGYAPSSGPFYFDARHSGEIVRFVLQGRRLTSRSESNWIVVQIGHTRLARDALELELITNGLAGLVALAGLGLFFVWFGINRALRPLAGIEKNLRNREPTDITPLQASPPREIENLIGSINGFIRRLRTSQEHAQTFIADVAHQTRTSLSALQGQLDLAARQTDQEEMKSRLVKAEAQSRRTIRLTNQLLAHAMVVHRANNQPMQTVNLVPIVKSALEELLRDTITRDLEFEIALNDIEDDQDAISGDPIAIREALRNLLDNAIKHGADGKRFDIQLEKIDCEGGHRLRLSVEDAGPGIPVEEREEALERFQSFGVGDRGSGLGLAIVRAVAESHGATLKLGASRHGGLRVELEFPTVAGP